MSRTELLIVVGAVFAGACVSVVGHAMIATRWETLDSPIKVVLVPPPVEPEEVTSVPDEAVDLTREGRSWGQEQVCGPPDSLQGGDVPSAWASATADGADEWLELMYAQPVRPIAVLVYESCAPGALSQIEFQNESGAWITVWGDDPKPLDVNTRIVNAPVDPDFVTSHVRVSLLSTQVPYWNEIDAVGLLDRTGSVHWAVAATASSSYAGDSREPLPPR